MAITLLTALACAMHLQAQEWPRFRGPNGAGVSDASKLPSEIGPDRKVIWKTALPPGHSSPIIAGERIFLTAADAQQKLLTICLDRGTGKILWTREAPRARVESFQPTNSPASPSAVTDGTNVFVFFGDYGILAYTVEGKEVWRHPLGPFNNANGHGSSPILVGGLLVLLCDQDTNSYLIALEKDTGKVAWKVERPEFTRCYSTPAVLYPKQGPPELIVPGSYFLTSYNAETGEKLWWIRGLSWQPKSTPLVDGDVVYAHWWEGGGEAEQPTETPDFSETLAKFDANKDGKLAATELASDRSLQRQFGSIDLGGDGLLDERDWNFYRSRRASRNALIAVRHGVRGDITDTNIIWRMQKFLPNVPSPLLYKGVLYLVKDGGIVTSVNPSTGKILKQGRLPDAVDTYYTSPVGGGDKVYFLSQHGKATVLKAGEQWEVLSTSDFEEECFATPAIAGDRMYLRTRSALYCLGDRKRR